MVFSLESKDKVPGKEQEEPCWLVPVLLPSKGAPGMGLQCWNSIPKVRPTNRAFLGRAVANSPSLTIITAFI